MFLKEMILGAI